MKLNLGCGNWLLPGYVNVDLYNPAADVKADVTKLPYANDSVDEIYTSHVIEHFDYWEALAVLKEWHRALKPGGWLVIETPDLLASCKKFAESDPYAQIEMYSHFFAKPWIPGEIHKFLFTEIQLAWHLDKAGFRMRHRIPARRYIGREDICLGMAAQK